MTVEAGKHMDGKIDALFSLTLLIRDTVSLTTIDYFFGMFALFDGVLDSKEVMPPRRSSSSMSSGLMPRVFQINLNYEVIENDLRTTKDVLAVEQEIQRVMRESVNTFNAQIQAFLTVRNKNRSIAFLIFSDIYV
jgi:hypothetical protein